MKSEQKPMEPVRPFPWSCPRCRRKAVQRVTTKYRCSRTHNGHPIEFDVEDLAVPRCANCDELVFDYEAEDQLREAFEAHLASLEAQPK